MSPTFITGPARWPELSQAPHWHRRLRRHIAAFLHAISQVLDKLAQRLLSLPRDPADPLHMEFWADAGAPEGALYVDGQLVGWIDGIKRL